MKKRALTILTLFISGLLLLSSCKDAPKEEQNSTEVSGRTTSVTIQANSGFSNASNQNFNVSGAINNIDRMEVTVKDASTDALYNSGVAMNFVNGKWSAQIDGLPVGANAAFVVDAYEQDDQSADIEKKTFSGITYKTLEGGDAITIALASTQSDFITLPQLYSVQVPSVIGTDTTTDITLMIRGQNNAKITYKINQGEGKGKFLQTSGTVQLNGNSASVIIPYVTTTSDLGNHTQSLTLTDDRGNSIFSTFKTNVVIAGDNAAGVLVQFAPRVKNIKVTPYDAVTQVRFTLYVETESGDSYRWPIKGTYESDASGDKAYFEARSCWIDYCEIYLRNYTASSKGRVQLTVTDDNNLSTTISTYLHENIFGTKQ